ncbi:hypothetical protein [Subtercola lobariae]|uniref:Uncharacterized protein n=1 Tax=Subtercola lobariae TaxID=1588641 RepID=A0A917B766_9MICO|nr:hypothetical protein [Subtercola lobariae]GGF29231.1 hypothetical protein GCM10011399_22970 [Subtercola lobariae]
MNILPGQEPVSGSGPELAAEMTGSPPNRAGEHEAAGFDGETHVAHPYVADDNYRIFTDDLDWGLL